VFRSRRTRRDDAAPPRPSRHDTWVVDENEEVWRIPGDRTALPRWFSPACLVAAAVLLAIGAALLVTPTTRTVKTIRDVPRPSASADAGRLAVERTTTTTSEGWLAGSAASDAQSVLIATLVAALALMVLAGMAERLKSIVGPGGTGIELYPLGPQAEAEVAAQVLEQLRGRGLLDDPDAVRDATSAAFRIARSAGPAGPPATPPESAPDGSPQAAARPTSRVWANVAEYAAKTAVDVVADRVRTSGRAAPDAGRAEVPRQEQGTPDSEGGSGDVGDRPTPVPVEAQERPDGAAAAPERSEGTTPRRPAGDADAADPADPGPTQDADQAEDPAPASTTAPPEQPARATRAVEPAPGDERGAHAAHAPAPRVVEGEDASAGEAARGTRDPGGGVDA
jgi:hypothetical protein